VRFLIKFIVWMAIGMVFTGLEGGMASGKEVTVGSVEEVVLLPWRIKMPARIDTGAAKSVLAARHLIVARDVAEFRLPEQYGGTLFRLPVVEWRHLRTRDGLEGRPIVEMEICLGPKRLRTQVALDDRVGLKYPFLVGRNSLKGNFVVDVKRKRITSPACP
jgi:hypothetical protein